MSSFPKWVASAEAFIAHPVFLLSSAIILTVWGSRMTQQIGVGMLVFAWVLLGWAVLRLEYVSNLPLIPQALITMSVLGLVGLGMYYFIPNGSIAPAASLTPSNLNQVLPPSSDPSVWIVSMEIIDQGVEGKIPAVLIKLGNNGKTVATATCWIQVVYETSLMTSTPPAPAVLKVGPNYIPAGMGTIATARLNEDIAKQWANIEAGTVFLYCYGFIKYTTGIEPFGNGYQLNFCSQYDSLTKTFFTCPFGNELKSIEITAPSSTPDKSTSPP